MRRKPRRIAPRLANKEKRVGIGHGLPPHIKEGLRLIGIHNNESVSWILEKLIIKSFKFKEPKYLESKSPVLPFRKRA